MCAPPACKPATPSSFFAQRRRRGDLSGRSRTRGCLSSENRAWSGGLVSRTGEMEGGWGLPLLRLCALGEEGERGCIGRRGLFLGGDWMGRRKGRREIDAADEKETEIRSFAHGERG